MQAVSIHTVVALCFLRRCHDSAWTLDTCKHNKISPIWEGLLKSQRNLSASAAAPTGSRIAWTKTGKTKN